MLWSTCTIKITLGVLVFTDLLSYYILMKYKLQETETVVEFCYKHMYMVMSINVIIMKHIYM